MVMFGLFSVLQERTTISILNITYLVNKYETKYKSGIFGMARGSPD